MAGVPLRNGFLAKEMFLAEALESHSGTVIDVLLPYLATLASPFSVFYSVRFIHQTFFGPPPVGLPRQPAAAPHWIRLPTHIMVLDRLLLGIVPALNIEPFLASPDQRSEALRVGKECCTRCSIWWSAVNLKKK